MQFTYESVEFIITYSHEMRNVNPISPTIAYLQKVIKVHRLYTVSVKLCYLSEQCLGSKS